MASVEAVLRTACHSVNQATERRPGSVRTSLDARGRTAPDLMIAATGQAKKTARSARRDRRQHHRVVRLNAPGRLAAVTVASRFGRRPFAPLTSSTVCVQSRDPLVAVRGDVLRAER